MPGVLVRHERVDANLARAPLGSVAGSRSVCSAAAAPTAGAPTFGGRPRPATSVTPGPGAYNVRRWPPRGAGGGLGLASRRFASRRARRRPWRVRRGRPRRGAAVAVVALVATPAARLLVRRPVDRRARSASTTTTRRVGAAPARGAEDGGAALTGPGGTTGRARGARLSLSPKRRAPHRDGPARPTTAREASGRPLEARRRDGAAALAARDAAARTGRRLAAGDVTSGHTLIFNEHRARCSARALQATRVRPRPTTPRRRPLRRGQARAATARQTAPGW